MSANTSHHILHRMVPLICQALTTSPSDEAVWLEGLRLLADPKLRTAMSITSSIWLPLLLKGLDASGPEVVILAALRLLLQVADTIEPIKSCLNKPLRALGMHPELSSAEEFEMAVSELGITILDEQKHPIRRPMTSTTVTSQANTPMPVVPTSREQPRLAEILARNLPSETRSAQHAWTDTLLSSPHDNSSVWLHNLFQATLEGSCVPEMVITSRLGTTIHEDMFPTAFLKCYKQIQDDTRFKNRVDEAIISLLSDGSVNRDISLCFLELIAFLHKEKQEVSPEMYDAAKRCAMVQYVGNGDLEAPIPAVILWYAEQESERNMTAQNIADLVEVNIRLGPSGYDSAWSSLLWLRDDFKVQPDPMWITQLSHWTTALEAQDKADKGGSVSTFASFNTRMICHHALGEFERGYVLAQSFFEGLNDWERRKTAHWAAASAWQMDDYDAMSDFLAFHPKGTSKSLYKAIIDVYQGQYASAFHHISKAQSLSYDELQAQLGVRHKVALKTLAKTEFLVELQEVIQYKSQPDLRPHILSAWKTRFERSHPDPNSWLKRLKVWTLACPPTTPELQQCYLECAKLCEGSNMREAANRLIAMVTPDVLQPGCKVDYTKLRLMWKDAVKGNDRDGMLVLVDKLKAHTSEYLVSLGLDMAQLESEGLGLRPLTGVADLAYDDRTPLGRRFCRLAEWTEAIHGPNWVMDPASEVYRYYSICYKLDESWFVGSYALATAAINIFEANGHRRSDSIAVNSYIVPAIRALFQAIRSPETPERLIKAILRLVTVWFRYGEAESVLVEVEHQLVVTPINSWLMAIPQLIARLGTQHKELQGVLIDLLKNIASHFPHAIIWPLLTASQTKKEENEAAARVVMNYICSMPDGTRLVSQAELVGRELIRTSISWLEKWRNIIDKCLPRTDLMEVAWHEVPNAWKEELAKLSAPETPDEEHFVMQFGAQLLQINKALVRYRNTRQVGLVNSAYSDLYRQLYGEIDAQLNQWRLPGSRLQLSTAAPRLLSIRDCILTVPGQYDPNIDLDDQAFIDSFHPSVDILSSKQLPRKLVIRSYTSDYTFLLKGNEDLRGDERIMQLFTLINTLLNHEAEAFGRNLHLLPYEVIPLSPSAGLVSWVPNTQQLQAMISNHREKENKKSLTNKELASLLGYDPETFTPHGLDAPGEMDRYDKLPLETKVERLKAAMSHCNQTDLKDLLWQRSPSAEIWIRRRTNFARTIGVGSFVGHIIGLGDRHLSNILVDQLSWGALHIDFGDLFGVAQERTFLPEKVPFRLTRMMTNALEVASCKGDQVPGSRGSFKQASIVTMGVLRDNRSSLLAMLEAFLYDPLLSWTADGSPSEATLSGLLYGISDVLSHPETRQQHQRQSNRHHRQRRPPPNETHDNPRRTAVHPPPLGGSNSDVLNRIDNSLVQFIAGDSYMAKVSGSGMTNSKALAVLAGIERKLAGYNKSSETPLSVKKQVHELVVEATSLENLAQGYVLGWIPHW
ncbi:hypothetical protein EHS25_001256 [Saitozyma podzolica]|uniref:non-specific serine/threonine protein kinase n=1 Tax=Saitozyma podzolica TaxID=1890683 RepID=A0A427YHU8_9TREE|nr:hypothetical protein EHS25_001256 [Saitozyma podzolica]